MSTTILPEGSVIGSPAPIAAAMGKHISQVGAPLIELEAQYRKKKGLLAHTA